MATLEQYTNRLYLAKRTKPRANTAKDGTFSVQLLAFSCPNVGAKVPWRLSWFGDDALGFWCQSGTDLEPGVPLLVVATHLQVIDGGGRNCGAEIQAHVKSLQVLPKAAKCSYIKTASSPCTATADSY